MKYILLMRHAKSSWDHPDLDDFDRPLAKRGKEDAPKMGEFLRASGYKPELIYSSPAERAKQTTSRVLEAAKVDENKVIWEEDLYFGTPKSYLKCVQSSDNDMERIMLVGHNPLMEQISALLCSQSAEASFRIPTAAIVCLQSFANSWKDVGKGTCQVKWMMIPKVLKEILP